ncbi:MAG TPA: reverse transcriptase domain-containing protein [Amoebophilaceae bacterium]|nr:reverse transcriptase domain-containing protein [Amoebophilaceae bacterium]
MMSVPMSASIKHKVDDTQLSAVVDKMVCDAGCPQGLKPRLKGILWENREVLAETNDSMGLCTAYKPRIPLNTEQPVFTPQYQIPFMMRKAMSEAIKAFLKMGVIQPSSSPYNSSSLMVPKRDGGFRLVVDFRRLNKHVVTDFHPLPRIQQIMETLHEAQYFTVLDLLHGFYNLEIDENDREKTAFSTHDRHWEFIRLPMGLKNSPSIFQRLMQIVLSGCLGTFAFIYIDDILIHSKTAERHLQDLTTILQRLKRAGLRIKASKCQLFRTEVEYLGFLTGREVLKVNPRKMEAITNFPRPVKVRDVQAFLGLIGYFRIFVRNFAERARPLYQLLKQDQQWHWTKECEDLFLAFKKILSEAPVLAFPDFTKPLILTTDASGYAAGAILSQIQDGMERIIASASKVFSDKETCYSNTEREMTAVVYGIDHFKSYLWGNKFVVYTDNNAVAEIARQDKTTSRKAFKWYTILHEYDFVVKHRDGKAMPHVDALSRYPAIQEKDRREIHYLSPSWQTTDFTPILDFSRWRDEMKTVQTPNKTSLYEYERIDDLLYRKSLVERDRRELFVPEKVRSYVLAAYHDSPAMGHTGEKRMLAAMKGTVYWPQLSQDVHNYVASCKKCQLHKSHRTKIQTAGRPAPTTCLAEVSMDLVGKLPRSFSGYHYVLCVQDRLSRFLIFVPIRDKQSDTVIKAFLAGWICRFGVPSKIVSDRGTEFMSSLFEALCKFLGVKHCPTTAYRPQGNSENERAHQHLHNYISMYLDEADAGNWDTLLHYAAWAHNSAVHRTLKRSPLEVLTGEKRRNISTFLPKGEDLDESEDWLEKYIGLRFEVLERIRDETCLAIAKAQALTQEKLNIHAKNPNWYIGQQVWVKEHPLTLVGKKWSAKYKGPYVIKDVIRPQVLKIHLEEDPSYVDIVHASYVRPSVSRKEADEDNEQAQVQTEQHPVIGKIDPVILNDPDEDYVERDEEEEELEDVEIKERFLTPEAISSKKSSVGKSFSEKGPVATIKDTLRALTPKALKWSGKTRQIDNDQSDQLMEPVLSSGGTRHNVSVYDDVTMGDNVSVTKEQEAASSNCWWLPRPSSVHTDDPMSNQEESTPRSTLTATRRPGLRSSFRPRSPSFTEHRRKHFWRTPPRDDNEQSMMDHQDSPERTEEMEISRQVTPPRLMKRLFDKLTPKSTTVTRAQDARLKQHRQGNILPKGSILDKENPFSVYGSKDRVNVRFNLRRRVNKPTWFQAGHGRRKSRVQQGNPNQQGHKYQGSLKLDKKLPLVAKMPTMPTARAALRPSPLSRPSRTAKEEAKKRLADMDYG